MATPTNPFENKSTYFVNPEDAAETGRLIDLDRVFTKEIGSLFPASLDLSQVHTVLDLGCGPGGWVIDVAHTYPDIDAIGVDISQKMMRYAHAHASAEGLSNASFQVMNILEPLLFPDDAFEFVNARLISSFMLKSAWPQFLQECRRVTVPGGMIRMTEGEWVFSNGEASEKFASLMTRAMWLSEKSFSPDGNRMGATLALRRLLSDVGLTNIQHQAYALEYSFGTEAYETLYQNAITWSKLAQPFLIKTGVTTQAEVDLLYEQLVTEMQEPEFLGLWFFRSVWGTTPA